ncbi:MAG TPA: hypothetical protein HPP97_06475 [Desulfuromonadales bacterium]|nr:hypothetical protein [Desulfuromonadales bacterium]
MTENSKMPDLSKEDLLEYYIQRISVEGLVVKHVFTLKFISTYIVLIIFGFILFGFCSVYDKSEMYKLGLVSSCLLFFSHSIRNGKQIVKGYGLPTRPFHWKTPQFEKKQNNDLKLAIEPYGFNNVFEHYNNYLTTVISQPSTWSYVKPALFLALFTPLWAAFLKRTFDLTKEKEVIWFFVFLLILCSAIWYYCFLMQVLAGEFVDRKQKHAKNLLDMLCKIKIEKERSELFKIDRSG